MMDIREFMAGDPTPEQINSYLDGVRWGEPLPQEQAPPVPADDEVMVVRSMRMSMAMDKRLKHEAQRQGLDKSELMRRLLLAGLGELEADQQTFTIAQLRLLLSTQPPAA